MKLISVGKYFAKIDDEDYELVSSYKWRKSSISKKNTTGKIYAIAHLTTKAGPDHNKSIRMHRLVMNSPKGLHVDHINGDTLDNRKENLRLATNQQNGMNRPATKGRKYKGVSFRKRNIFNKYEAQIGIQGKFLYLGSFETEIEAAQAYDKKAVELYGEFAVLNFKER